MYLYQTNSNLSRDSQFLFNREVAPKRPLVYIDTSVVSYLTAKPSLDLVKARRQKITEDWWYGASNRFDLVASILVIEEAEAGDPSVARLRLESLKSIRLINATPKSYTLADSLINLGAVPKKARDDAVHIAIAATADVDFLTSWNLKHIANETRRNHIKKVCQQSNYNSPIICTPNELMEGKYGRRPR